MSGSGRQRRRLLLLSAAVGLCSSVMMVGSAQAMSLKDAIQLVLTTNPDIGVVAKDRRAVDQELRQAWGLYFPQIDVKLDAGPEFTESGSVDHPPTYLKQGPEDGGRWLVRSDAQITLQQRLFDGFEAASEVQRQKARVNSAAERVQDQSEVSALDATQQYLNVLRDQERLKNSDENISKHNETLALVQKRAELGGGNAADVSQAQARLETAHSTHTDIQGQLRETQTKFLQVVGVPAQDLEDVSGIDMSRIPENVDLSVQKGLENNPKVRLAKHDVERADAEVREQTAVFYPAINLEAVGSVNRYNSGLEEVDHNAQFLLVMRYNIYRGGADLARVREFKQRRSEALETLRTREREVEQEVRSSWAARQTQQERIEILQRQVQANQQTYEGYVQQFDIGQRGLLDVLDAANELFISNDQLIQARYEERFSEYRILAAQGQLIETAGLTYPVEGTVGPISDEDTSKKP
ncbi:MAG TPA: TolC family outer membrane protein [Candidatus Cybelea sp.]|nr:TolC family outer membrane protein [Candidatus Cybelea sp.]